ncbi:MAG: hypothetical protein GXP26_02280 [Planctomycetes bacterium]|nr:hypothetical protein [Planctomycetota bacterium]
MKRHLMRVQLAFGLVLVSLNLGCESSAPPETPVVQVPEKKFDWVIKRLEHALEAFSPSGSFGLRAKRELSYELFPPTNSQPNYTAQVIIVSKTAYHPEFQSLETQPKKAEPKVDSSIYDPFLNEDPLADPLDDPDQRFAELPIKEPITPGVSTPSPRTNDREVFDLAYLDDRWQLITSVESKRARNWFEYALE